MKEELSSTLEDYLEAIYRIEQEKRVARPGDISEARDVARSTVTSALQSLGDKGLINYEPYGLVTLTEKGRDRAEWIATRHHVMRDFLENVLGLDAERADETACGMEHALERDAMERLVCFLLFLRKGSAHTGECLDAFKRFMEQCVDGGTCRECVEEYVNDITVGEFDE